MSRYDSLNLLDVPPPDAVVVPSEDALLSTRMADLVARLNAAGIPYNVGGLEFDPLEPAQETSTHREAITNARINDAVRAVLLASATGADLDNVVADFALKRQTLVPANPAAVPPVAAVMEGDPSLKQRRLLAPEALSTAGPGGAYDFYVLDALAGVAVDCISYGPEDAVFDGALPFSGPGTVASCYLPAQGNTVPTGILSRRVAASLNSWSIFENGAEVVVFDKSAQALQDKRPLSDRHRVRCADVVPYTFEVAVRIPPGPDAGFVLAQVETRLAALGEALYALATGVPRQLAEGASVIFDDRGRPLVTAVLVASPAADLPPLPLGAYRCAGVAVSGMAG